MPRVARAKSGTGIYHVIIRGVNRQKIFQDDKDRKRFLQLAAKYKKECGFELYAYCLMINHVHLLLREHQEPLAQIMKRISSSYALWYNKKHERCGHLFQERFRSEPVENNDYFLTVLRYIHQNPQKAGFVDSVEGYKWSSYHEYIKEQKDGMVDTEPAFRLIEGNNKSLECIRKPFISLHKIITGDDACMEMQEEAGRVSDEQLRIIIKDRFGLKPEEIQKERAETQARILGTLKRNDGTSLRQIARITGVTVYKVSKA